MNEFIEKLTQKVEHLNVKWDMKELEYYESLSPEKQKIYLVVRALDFTILNELEEETHAEETQLPPKDIDPELLLERYPLPENEGLKLGTTLYDLYLESHLTSRKRDTNLLYKLSQNNPQIVAYYAEFNANLKIWSITQDFIFTLEYYREWDLPQGDRALYFFIKELVGFGLIVKNVSG